MRATLMFQKILIAISDSPDSAQISASGLLLAEKFGAEILLLHVINPGTINGFEAIGTPLMGGIMPMTNDLAIEAYLQQSQDTERRGLELLQSYAKQAIDRQIKVEILQHIGNSGMMICETAKKWTADTILLGRNQKSVLSEIFLGSTSNYVLHHALCSVITIHLN
jgi:nucleotide-binding universal stress UspA family protein